MAKDVPDIVELLVARAIGRNLTSMEGCVIQAIALIAFGCFVYWFFTSGAFVALITPLVEWYSHQIRLGPSPTPR